MYISIIAINIIRNYNIVTFFVVSLQGNVMSSSLCLKVNKY